MLSLGQARRQRGSAGDPISLPFSAFGDYDIVFRRGQLVLLVAGSGTGKSALGLTIAVRANAPTLYYSADSDSFTQVSRVFQVHRRVDSARARRYASGQDDEAADGLDKIPIRWDFNSSPTFDDLELSVAAFEELYGEYPHLIIVDNVTNVLNGHSDNGADPFAGLEGSMDFLDTMARETQACVLAMHHSNGPYADGSKPIPLSGIKGQIHRRPAMILTMFSPDDYTRAIAPVKNRGARHVASGEWFAQLAFDGERMQFTDMAR